MSIFDKWTDLDPVLTLRRIEASHGSVIFNKFSYLDPYYAIRQVETALGIDLDNTAMDFNQLKPAIDAALGSGGGSTAPAWVPANAKIHIDFIGNRAWTGADGEVAIAVLLGTDSNAESGWGATSYNPADLTVNGLYTVNVVAFIEAARDALISGATFTFRTKNIGPDPNNLDMEYLSADGAAGMEVLIKVTTHRGGWLTSWNGSADVRTADNVVNNGDGTINMFAVTIVPTRADMAINGTAAVTTVLNGVDFPTSGASPLVASVMEITGSGGSGTYWQTFTIYDPLPTTTGLSELSALS